MEEMNSTLDKDEFIDASKRLYETLTIFDKDLILAFSEKWEAKRSLL